MKIIAVPQNSKEWIAWRGKGLGASDAPAVMGVSPWTSPFELWTYLTGLCTRPEAHPMAVAAMKRGQELEPIVRRLYEAYVGFSVPAVSGEHDVHPFIRASLDGLSVEGLALAEFKCPGKVDHAKALKTKQVPTKYVPQVQQQFMVSGASGGDYVSWDGQGVGPDFEFTREAVQQLIDDGHLVIIPVAPDKPYMEVLEARLVAFWARVQLVLPPDATCEDLDRLTTRLASDTKRLNNTVRALELATGALEVM